MVNVDLYSAIITKVLLIRSTGRAVLVLARPRPSIPPPSASLPFQCQINANRGPWQLFAQGRLGPTYVRQTKLYACERVDSRQWHEWHGQPLESIRHAGSYFVPISIRPIFIFFVVAEVMSNYLTTDGLKNFSLLSEAPLRPEVSGICHICASNSWS